MKATGYLTQWFDDKGYGFITPSHGKAPIYLHISAMQPGQQRPQLGSLMSYQVSQDNKGRLQANAVKINKAPVVNNAYPNKQPRRSTSAKLQCGGASLFMLGLIIVSWQTWLPIYTPLWFMLVSVASYICYSVDKRAAQQHRRRISEAKLQWLALLGGWPGAVQAQQRLRHKSSKTSFLLVFYAMVLLNLVLLGLLIYYRALLPAELYDTAQLVVG